MPTNPWTGNLQSIIIMRGQAALRYLVQRVGSTTTSASRTAQVSRGTLERWIADDAGGGILVGLSGPTRNTWPGYPAPLPALDEVILRSDLPYSSFLEALHAYSSEGVDRLQGAPFGLLSLSCGYDRSRWLQITRETSLPGTTALRIVDPSHEYPSQLKALDRLVRSESSLAILEAWIVGGCTAGRPMKETFDAQRIAPCGQSLSLLTEIGLQAPRIRGQVLSLMGACVLSHPEAIGHGATLSQMPEARWQEVASLPMHHPDRHRILRDLEETSNHALGTIEALPRWSNWLEYARDFDGTAMTRGPAPKALLALLESLSVPWAVQEHLQDSHG